MIRKRGRACGRRGQYEFKVYCDTDFVADGFRRQCGWSLITISESETAAEHRLNELGWVALGNNKHACPNCQAAKVPVVLSVGERILSRSAIEEAVRQGIEESIAAYRRSGLN